MMASQRARVRAAREARRRLAQATQPAKARSRRWRIDARAPSAQRLDVEAALVALGFTINPRPPAAGPELEASFTVRATSEEGARAVGRRYLERRGVEVLAIRASPIT